MPNTWVCSPADRAIKQLSLAELLRLGAMALGGGEVSFVLLSKVDVDVLVFVLSVLITSSENTAPGNKISDAKITKNIFLSITLSFILQLLLLQLP